MGRAEGSYPRVDLYWGVGRSLQSQVSCQRSQFFATLACLGRSRGDFGPFENAFRSS